MSDDAEYLEPANSVIEKLGGPEKAAEAAGVHVTRARRWRLPKNPANPKNGGTGGIIPSTHQQPLLDWARAHNIELTPEDFFVRAHPRSRSRESCGRSVAA
ncbi:MAG: hypothetical protein C4523_10560 [Myxococcales bacterium]|jgi:hypothetical protein|nr:MAG: hypothetical protein C4523_10560 [Myxococcales bacterium]